MSAEDKIIEIILSILPGTTRENCSATLSLVEDLGADSINIAEIFMEIEEEFGISIPDSDAITLATIGSIVEYLNTRNVK